MSATTTDRPIKTGVIGDGGLPKQRAGNGISVIRHRSEGGPFYIANGCPLAVIRYTDSRWQAEVRV